MITVDTETITIKVKNGRWYKTFNDYSRTYRISKEEAMESIEYARSNDLLFNEMKDWWSYYN